MEHHESKGGMETMGMFITVWVRDQDIEIIRRLRNMGVDVTGGTDPGVDMMIDD